MKKLVAVIFILFFWQPGFTQPCTGVPPTATVVPYSGPCQCQCSIAIGAVGHFSVQPVPIVSGIMYQWQWSVNSASGPYNNIPGLNNSAGYTIDNFTNHCWLRVVMTCSNSGLSINAEPIELFVYLETETGLNDPHAGVELTHVYPNPVGQNMKIEFAGTAKDLLLAVYTIDGREVPVESENTDDGKTIIDTRNLEEGIYILKIFNADRKISKLFVVER